MRILHFSDVHLPLEPRDLALASWFGKRGVGGLNLLLGRGRCFEDAAPKLVALERFAREQGVDLAINTGDSTALGSLAELERARAALEPFGGLPRGLITLPGNHDLYVSDSLPSYAATFGDAVQTDLPDLAAVDGLWPFARLIDDDLAVVGVNSARPNPLLWRSSGLIGGAQLEALERMLEDPRIRDRVVLVMTHYAPRLANGAPDTVRHGLVDADAFLRVCRGIRRGAVLHGHIHWRYRLQPEGMRVPIFCAGSATKEGREGLWLLDVEGNTLRATPGTYRDGAYVLDSDETAPSPAPA